MLVTGKGVCLLGGGQHTWDAHPSTRNWDMFDMSDGGEFWSGFSRYNSCILLIQSYLDLSPLNDQEEVPVPLRQTRKTVPVAKQRKTVHHHL